jgi:hypothetical protein
MPACRPSLHGPSPVNSQVRSFTPDRKHITRMNGPALGLLNPSWQPTPGGRPVCFPSPLARRGCTLRFGVCTSHMKTIVLVLLTLTLCGLCHAADSVEKQWFGSVDGVFTKGEFIDLNTNATERLYIRYGPISDSGVELERTADNVVVWRAHVQPLGVEHSKYRHEVRVRIEDDKVLVTSIGAEQIYEVHSVKTGAIISRKVEDVRR